MNKFNFLAKLLKFETAGFPVASIYLNTEANETGKKDFEVFLKKQLSEQAGSYDSGSSEGESFARDIEKINEFIESIDPTTQGTAIFASSGTDEFFHTFEFAVPFEEDQFFVFDTPHIYPLVRLVARNSRYAIASADTNSAHIYVVNRGKMIEREDIQNTKTNRSEVGGWSQMRYQRHIDNFHQQHAKEVVEELEKLSRDERVEKFVLAGDEAVIIPLLRGEMSKDLEEKFVGSLPLNVNTPENELHEAAEKLVREYDENVDREKIANLVEQDYEDGIGVTGVEKALTALLNGQVMDLYMTSDPAAVTFHNGAVLEILKDYSPGERADLPDSGLRNHVVDELLKYAVETADDIRFIDDVDLLKSKGGVGALLRYQAKGVSNL